MNGQTVSSEENGSLLRLEDALDRIAFALDRQAKERADAARSTTGPDIETLAANLDALCARIRNVVGQGED